MKRRFPLYLLFIISISFILVSCESNDVTNTAPANTEEEEQPVQTDTTRSDSTNTGDDSSGSSNSDWLIPVNDVVDGGVGKDGIPSIDDPKFTIATSVNFMSPEDLVIGIKFGDMVRAYPHKILNYHEIVNDRAGQTYFCITYCPLTGTGIAWNRNIDDEVTEFGVSGLLYKNNLIAYDRNTDSEWAQMLNMSVHGEQKHTQVETFNIIETKWSTWLEAYPSSQVLNRQTGYSRDYSRSPYGDYSEDNDAILFPIGNQDDRLPKKERVHGIEINSSYVSYPIAKFENRVTLTNTTVNEAKIVVVGNSEDNFVESYYRSIDGNTLEFSAIQDEYPVIMEDESGSKWNIFGESVSGTHEGKQLQSTQSYNGYWFAFADFFPDLPIKNPQTNTSIPEY